MSTTLKENSIPNNLLKDIITTPYMKVLSILKEAKKYINMMSKSQSKLIRELDWTIKVITSHSLYTYEFEDSELISKYQQENPDFKQFIDFVTDYNEEVIEVNKKNNLLLSKTAQMKNDLNLLQTPSLKIKKHNLVFNNGSRGISKKKYSGNNINLRTTNTNTSCTNNNTKLSLSSLKQVMKNGGIVNSFGTNTYNNNNFHIYNNSNITPIHKEHKNKFGLSKTIISLTNFNSFHQGNNYHRHSNSNNNEVKMSESPVKQIHKRFHTPSSNETKLQKYSFIYLEGILAKSGFDPKKILNKEFDIFELKALVGHENVLPLMGKTILDAFGINEKMINTAKLDPFLIAVSNSYYTTVPYHNSIHGADVTQTISLFFLNSNAEEVCATSMLDILSILIASLGHDIGHPGLTNNFQINSCSDMALTYNDISCLENYHASKLFRVVRSDANNIFEKLSVLDYKSFRKRIISMILATDMANHGKVMSMIKARIQLDANTNPDGTHKVEILTKNPKTQFEEQQALLDYFIHAADLAHNTKLFSISLQWVELLSNEFWNQGDKEKSMNLPVSFLCERVNSDIPNSQVGFIKGFILPTFDVLVQMFPTLNYTVENAKNNLAEWEKLVEEHRKTGWTPRDRREDNDENNKGEIKNCVTNGNSVNNMNNQNKKTFTANWGKPKLIIVHKTKGSNEHLVTDKK